MCTEREREREEEEEREGEGERESVSVRERDGEQTELQTKTSCLPCGDLILVVGGRLCFICGDSAGDSATGECRRDVLSSWLRPTEQRESCSDGFCMISKVCSFSLKVHYVDTGRAF